MEQSCNGGAWLKSHSRSLGNGVSEVEVFVLVKGGLVQFLCVTKRDFSSHPFFFFLLLFLLIYIEMKEVFIAEGNAAGRAPFLLAFCLVSTTVRDCENTNKSLFLS